MNLKNSQQEVDKWIQEYSVLYFNGLANVDEVAGVSEKQYLKPEIIEEITKKTGLTFVPENENGSVCFANNNDELRDEFKQVFTIKELLYYIYGMLYSTNYNENYDDFFEIDFLKIPFPKEATTFWEFVNLGMKIREIHLSENK